MLKKNLLSIAVVTAALSLAACNDKEAIVEPVEPAATTDVVVEPEVAPEAVAEADATVTPDAMATQSIAELAAANPNLSILTAALKAAGLDGMMMEAGEYTVFAPTDDAFAALLTKLNITKEALLADKDLLKSVLPYHVVPMVVKAADIPYDTAIETVNGQTIMIGSDNVITDASGNKANITATDMMATNGVVHVIDTVLLPK